MTEFNKLWARFVSVLFHPLLMPSLGIIVLFALPSYVSYSVAPQAKRLVVLIVFINTCIAPLLIMMFFKRIGLVSSILLNDRIDRIYPVLATVLFYFFTYYLFRKAQLPSLVNFYVMGGMFLVLIGFIVTLYWKISIHMLSMGGITGFFIATSYLLQHDMPILIVSFILFSGLVGSARIKLNAHNPAQVYAGFIAGVSVMLLLFLYLR